MVPRPPPRITNLPPVRVYPLALELPQEPRFKNLIDRAIEELLNSGELDSLLRNYYGSSPYASISELSYAGGGVRESQVKISVNESLNRARQIKKYRGGT
jgi:hypothetical protein